MSEKEEKTENLFQKIGTNLKKEFNHRTKSNVIASYIITWIILNWKSILYLIFSSDSIKVKLSSNYTQPTWGTFFCPFIGVGIYLLIVPILESVINVTSNWITGPINDKIREQQYNLKMADIEDDIQLEVERNKFFEEMSNESEFERLTKSNLFLEKKIEELNTILQSKDNTINNLSKEIDQLNKSSSSNKNNKFSLYITLALSFPKTVEQFKSLFSEHDIVDRTEISDKDAQILLAQNLIAFDKEHDNYKLTEEGKSLRDYINSRSK
ncbi:hypothetical protein [Fluviicola taffensis]|uniref:hypothetical protein n=1 Tax=Fluviicola taffensis TaxID=191579 RepID=UPI003137BBDC